MIGHASDDEAHALCRDLSFANRVREMRKRALLQQQVPSHIVESLDTMDDVELSMLQIPKRALTTAPTYPPTLDGATYPPTYPPPTLDSSLLPPGYGGLSPPPVPTSDAAEQPSPAAIHSSPPPKLNPSSPGPNNAASLSVSLTMLFFSGVAAFILSSLLWRENSTGSNDNLPGLLWLQWFSLISENPLLLYSTFFQLIVLKCTIHCYFISNLLWTFLACTGYFYPFLHFQWRYFLCLLKIKICHYYDLNKIFFSYSFGHHTCMACLQTRFKTITLDREM